MLDVGKLIPYIGDIHFPLSLWYNNMVSEIVEYPLDRTGSL